MNPLDFYTKLNNTLRNYHILPYWFFTPLRISVRYLANWYLPRYLSKPIYLNKYRVNSGVVVSFTSFPERINNVWQVVECMLHQTVLPSKILLWLSKDQFKDENSIPNSLKDRVNDVFEIRMVDGDIKSHKKYYYVSKEYPDSLVFLIDDDIYYPTDILERSLLKFKNYKNCVVCNFGSQITFNQNGEHKKYSCWKEIEDDSNLFFGSGGGTLFIPSKLYKDLTNIEIAMSLTPSADDIWLNAMTRLAGLSVTHVYDLILLPIMNKQTIELNSINNGLSKNDEQIEAVENYYGRCFDR